jgi:hypothetical protein
MRADTAADNEVMEGGGDTGYFYIYVETGSVFLNISSGDINLPSFASLTNQWSHYAITFTSTATKFFFNGKYISTERSLGINVFKNLDFGNINNIRDLIYMTNIRLTNSILYTGDYSVTLPLTGDLVIDTPPEGWDVLYGNVYTLVGPIEIGSS